MEIAIKVIQFILSLSILIIIHELGHFLTARYFKTRVEKFYLFFNPWFSIFKKKVGDTEYGMGWLPLGGYVKISGMIDESMDKEQLKQQPQPWEFRSKPAWQRLIIMLGGVTFNVLLAILIYIVMLSVLGEKYLPAENVRYGIYADSLAREIGLEHGDKILYLDNRKIDDFSEIPHEFVVGGVSMVTVERNGELINLDVPEDFFAKIISSRGANFISIRFPFIAEGFMDDSPAKQAGMEVNDQIVGINNINTWSFDEFRNQIVNYKGENVDLQVLRNGEQITIPITIPESALIGVYLKPINDLFEFENRTYSLLAAIPAGTVKAWKTSIDYLRQLRLLFRPEVKASESLGGFITIGSIFAPTWDWVHFWTITAFLSIILAIMNVMPIPALDGGHVVFLLYEIVAGRKPSDKFMEYAQTVGMVLLLGLIIFAQYNDIMRLFK
jgi:regulator of sigma E protease